MTIAVVEDARSDLLARFFASPKEKDDANRFLYNLLQAQWFYQKHYEKLEQATEGKVYRMMNDVVSLHRFGLWLFGSSKEFQFTKREIHLFFREYFYRIPVCGAIIFKDSSKKEWLTVRSRYGRRIGFPKGKINQSETDEQCAIREVKEETGLNISSLIDASQSIEFRSKKKRVKLYIITLPPDSVAIDLVAEDRSEIAECSWTATASTDRMHYVDESRRAIQILQQQASP